MSEAKSLVVWKTLDEMLPWAPKGFMPRFEIEDLRAFEYAHDLSGRFLGVFREVKP